ncbi:RDD family protein [Actinospica sp. MGRD01-02]|uniref:RDD family protein n=1 Tax=Actinospica acidithermotolerans TaxID=2828514 RepID=A0A941E7V9_9ACTN|nr:RDD family protein [Actinospica acidithermotolerans]MBR7825427.1 RDD family protein [Actinospica acidithermotolerans]
MSTGNPPAGYYADPSIPGYIRYWDGNEWVAGTSRPAPDEAERQAAEQGLAASQADAVPADSSGTWTPEPAAAAAASPDHSQAAAAGRSGARGYAQVPQQPQPPREDPQVPQQPVVQPQVQPDTQAQSQVQPDTQAQSQAQPRFPAQPQQYAQPAPQEPVAQPQRVPQVPQQPVVQPDLQPQGVPQQPVAPSQVQPDLQPQFPAQPQQHAQSPASAPATHRTATPVPSPRQPQLQPEPPQQAESVATMIVPSAFAPSQRTGTYRLPGLSTNPFAGLPGTGFGASTGPDDEDGEGEATVVELATPGSRFLGRIIDLGIAAIFSAPITVTLLLIAHRHDHQYVLRLDAEATTTYTTLGMDAVGIALWAGALLAFVIVSVAYEGYRLGRGGQTFGKRLAGVQIVQLPSGQPLRTSGVGTRRALFFWALAIIPLVDIFALGGVLWGRPYRQGVHEKATSTVTVKA